MRKRRTRLLEEERRSRLDQRLVHRDLTRPQFLRPAMVQPKGRCGVKLSVAKNLTLPSDAVTQTFGIIGRKGSGKTYAAGKLTECFLDAGIQVVVLDPVGNWYGLRLDRSGKKPSRFKIPILGGEHGDVPLEYKAGQTVADFVIENGSSAVLDVSPFRKGQRKEFVADFAEQLYLKQKRRRTPMHIVIEEAQVFAPQRCGRGEERMLGAMEDICRLGRNCGMGVTMVSQRPQSVNKEVFNQAEPLIVFQLTGPHERKAVLDWVKHTGSEVDLAGLPSLRNGECFFWSPAWLQKFVQTRFHAKETFDASATPKVGERMPEPKHLKPADLKALTVSMADVIETAKANDPKALKRQIAQLKRDLNAKQSNAVVGQGAIDRAVASATTDRDKHWKGEIRKVERQRDEAVAIIRRVNKISIYNGEGVAVVEPPAPVRSHVQAPRAPRPEPTTRRVPSNGRVGESGLPKGEAAILSAVLNYTNGCSRTQLTVLTGYKRSSRDAYIQRLRERGLVEAQNDRIVATAEGTAAMPEVETLPSGSELQEFWRNKLPVGEWAILEVLIGQYPDPVDRDTISDQTDYKRSSRDAYIQRLKARELVFVSGSAGVVASENLFD